MNTLIRHSKRILYLSFFASLFLLLNALLGIYLTMTDNFLFWGIRFMSLRYNGFLFSLSFSCIFIFFVLYLFRENKKSSVLLILSFLTIIICILNIIYSCLAFIGKYCTTPLSQVVPSQKRQESFFAESKLSTKTGLPSRSLKAKAGG